MVSFVNAFTTLRVTKTSPVRGTHHEYSTADWAQTRPTAYDNY
jgi:hypothetical protein